MSSIVSPQIVSRSSFGSFGNKAKTYSDCFCAIIWRISEGADTALAISARVRSRRERGAQMEGLSLVKMCSFLSWA